MEVQLLLLQAQPCKPIKRRQSHRPDAAGLLLFLNAFLSLKVIAREYQLVQEQYHSAELLARLQMQQDEVAWLTKELKQAEKDNQEKKKRNRIYNRTCVNCAAAFQSKSFDRNYCDACKPIAEQRRKGFNKGQNKLK